MVDMTEVPYISFSKKAFLPKYYTEYKTNFVYDLFSPINGNEITRGENYICLHLELVIPIGVMCYLKALHFENNGEYIKDERLDKGIVRLYDGQNHALNLKIPKKMSTLNLKRGEKLGSIIFDRAVVFKPFHIISKFENSIAINQKMIYPVNHKYLLKFKKLSELAYEPKIQHESAGIDLCSPIFTSIQPQETLLLNTDLAFEIPEGFYGRIAGRSGISSEHSIDVLGGFNLSILSSYLKTEFIFDIN